MRITTWSNRPPIEVISRRSFVCRRSSSSKGSSEKPVGISSMSTSLSTLSNGGCEGCEGRGEGGGGLFSTAAHGAGGNVGERNPLLVLYPLFTSLESHGASSGRVGESSPFPKLSPLFDCIPNRSEYDPESVVVGVWLLKLREIDIIDIAEPGRGLGLGLGGTSVSVSIPLESELISMTGLRLAYEGSWTLRLSEAEFIEVERPPVEETMPAADADVEPEVELGSILYDTPPPLSFITITDLSKRNSFSVDEREPGVNFLVRIRGLRPLSRTFFLADIPIQSTSCFMASRSDTARRGAVRRMVLALGRVP